MVTLQRSGIVDVRYCRFDQCAKYNYVMKAFSWVISGGKQMTTQLNFFNLFCRENSGSWTPYSIENFHQRQETQLGTYGP